MAAAIEDQVPRTTEDTSLPELAEWVAEIAELTKPDRGRLV